MDNSYIFYTYIIRDRVNPQINGIYIFKKMIDNYPIYILKNSIESINEKKSKNAVFKGKINVDIKEDSDYIYVTVVDNGLGFAQVDKVKMLTPYFTTKKKGTGLGLPIVNKIINEHSGEFVIKKDKGTIIEIWLPSV